LTGAADNLREAKMNEKKNNDDTRIRIQRFGAMQLYLHRYAMFIIIGLILTALPVLHRDFFSWVAYIFGGPANVFDSQQGIAWQGVNIARLIHRILGVGLILISVIFVLWALFFTDRRWDVLRPRASLGKVYNYYFRGIHERFGKYNPGQSFMFRLVMVYIVLAVISGIIMWFRGYFPLGIVRFAHLLHAIAFFTAIAELVVHVYFGIIFPPNRKGAAAMFGDGYMPADFAKEHHEGWYEEVMKK
jgi:formate dehydrogenase subunit gamma